MILPVHPIISVKDCKPKTNILFLKTHKTASTTIQNVLFRYGDEHNLTFYIPTKLNYIDGPQLFNRAMLSSSTKHNIFTFNAIFNHKEMKQIMPLDAIFVTILREPVSLIESLCGYYNLKQFNGEESAIRFLETVFSVSPNTSAYHILSMPRRKRVFGRNQMSFDLGLNPKYFDDMDSIRKFIAMLHSSFQLVMIAERFEESLILLKELMCWTLEDIVVFRHNARVTTVVNSLTADLKRRMRLYSQADVLLYQYFCDKLDRQIAACGVKKMKQQVLALQRLTEAFYHTCVKKEVQMS